MYLYIIESQKDKTYYVGISCNVDKRIKYHNFGRVKSTKSKLPWKLIYVEKHKNRIAAREREKYLKSYKGSVDKKKIIKSIHNYSGIV